MSASWLGGRDWRFQFDEVPIHDGLSVAGQGGSSACWITSPGRNPLIYGVFQEKQAGMGSIYPDF
ncbi:MAG: hypothetical protein A2W28_03690 [Gammaproteobacteria bacterium RBG_16_51_14]|nr:MAG: hypothetical protein A2W28_03690 [Gammaproteobacteria bacterium RBG_16_51_14]